MLLDIEPITVCYNRTAGVLQNVVQSHLVEIQPQFKTNLMESVQTYKHNLASFFESYGLVGHPLSQHVPLMYLFFVSRVL